MEVIYLDHTKNISKQEQHVMAIGFFDGVHLGHQRLFKTAKMQADKLGVACSALTFSPHPDEVIKGDVNRKYITPLKEKLERIEACGIDKTYVISFDMLFASLPPMDFIHHYIKGMNVRHIVVGFDFTFGKMAKGNTSLLKEAAMQENFGLSVIPQLTYAHTKIGSTETKQLIQAGNVEEVPRYLGSHYEVKGKVKRYRPISSEYIVQTNGQVVLPEEGTFHVSVKANNMWHEAELIVGTDNESYLVLFNNENLTDQSLRIVFKNRLEVQQAVTI